MPKTYLALNLRGKRYFSYYGDQFFYQCDHDQFIVFNYSDTVQAFPWSCQWESLNFFQKLFPHYVFFALVFMIRHLILFSMFVFDFSGDVPSKPALNELHKPPIIKGNNSKLSKHDIKLEILLFSIVKLDTSFYCVCVPTIIIHI